MTLELSGRIEVIYPAVNVTDKFRKREMVLAVTEVVNGNNRTEYAKFQFSQGKCELLDTYHPGDMVKVNFNIRGIKYQKGGKEGFITNLDAWRIERMAAAQTQQQAQPEQDYWGK